MVTHSSSERSTIEQKPDEPWFSGRPGTILLYRVNRRPYPQQSMFAESQPSSVLDHMTEVLLFGEEVETGRRTKRYWFLGNRQVDERSGVLTGQVGWQSTSREAGGRFDLERQVWVDVVGERDRSARAPFAFEAESRTLAVLKHPSFSERVVPYVFATLLQRGESARPTPTTEWDVEPRLDTADFRQWLSGVDVVDRVQFVAKLPNPDGLDEFGSVWQRMEQHKAKLLKEIMEAADPEIGIVDLENDQVVNGYLAMSEHAFGYVTARGTQNGRQTRFDQRASVARRQTEPLPSTWGEAMGVVLAFARQQLRRRRDS